MVDQVATCSLLPMLNHLCNALQLIFVTLLVSSPHRMPGWGQFILKEIYVVVLFSNEVMWGAIQSKESFFLYITYIVGLTSVPYLIPTTVSVYQPLPPPPLSRRLQKWWFPTCNSRACLIMVDRKAISCGAIVTRFVCSTCSTHSQKFLLCFFSIVGES